METEDLEEHDIGPGPLDGGADSIDDLEWREGDRDSARGDGRPRSPLTMMSDGFVSPSSHFEGEGWPLPPSLSASSQSDLDTAHGRRSSASSTGSDIAGLLPPPPMLRRQEAGSAGGVSDGEGAGGEEDGGGGGQVTYDLHVPAQHTYLGDVDDLSMGPSSSSGGPGSQLEEGRTYSLPLLPLEGVVMVPGATLPLRLVHASDRALVQRSLAAPAPTTRLLAVLCSHRFFSSQVTLNQVGCIVELRQLRAGAGGGAINAVAKGRQRFELCLDRGFNYADLSTIPIRVLPDQQPTPVPREVHEGCTWWGSWAYRPFDCYRLGEEASALLRTLAPNVQQFRGDPLALSYWMVANLPMEEATRQRLLEARSVADRLKLEIKLMRQMSVLRCRYCQSEVGSMRDMVRMSEEGLSSVFVNAHGYVHDMVTLRRVSSCWLEGEPDSTNSWFPGYSWTIAHCSACRSHLGWRFTADREGLVPHTFWGLRRDVLGQLPVVWQEAAHDDDDDEDGGGGSSE